MPTSRWSPEGVLLCKAPFLNVNFLVTGASSGWGQPSSPGDEKETANPGFQKSRNTNNEQKYYLFKENEMMLVKFSYLCGMK